MVQSDSVDLREKEGGDGDEEGAAVSVQSHRQRDSDARHFLVDAQLVTGLEYRRSRDSSTKCAEHTTITDAEELNLNTTALLTP